MQKIHVPYNEKSQIAKKLICDLREEIGSFSEQIVFGAPTEKKPGEYWMEIHDQIILPAVETYNEINETIGSNFESQMEKLVYHAIGKGPSDKDKIFGIDIGRNGYVITYNDGNEFFTWDKIKSEWEAKSFNYFSKKQKWENCYNALGKKLSELGSNSELSIEKETGNFYIFENTESEN